MRCSGFSWLLPALFLCSCKDRGSAGPDIANRGDTITIPAAGLIPDFNADSAYFSVATQVAFGPRLPGSDVQSACAALLEAVLRRNCDTVYRQQTVVKGGDGKTLPCINLVGVINPAVKKRVLLLAHWDSRPWAEEDTRDRNTPVPGADDGGSGTAVLLEIARAIKSSPLKNTGVDILLTDVEDYGKDEWGDDSYCLGTQYWAHNPHIPGYTAAYGILLDMVGARGALFPLEEYSKEMAGPVQQKVWAAAVKAGFAPYFSDKDGGGVLDDHTYVNEIIHIPTIDIINLPLPATASGFAPHWHTHNDNMDVIDRSTLRAVGQTLLQVLYDEDAGPDRVVVTRHQ